MKITTGKENYEIYDAGTLIFYNDEPLTFEISTLKFLFKFQTNNEIKDQKLDFNVVDKKTIEIILSNFDDPLGTGNLKPLNIGEINNKQLYLNFVVRAPKNLPKILTYTWYLREEVKHG